MKFKKVKVVNRQLSLIILTALVILLVVTSIYLAQPKTLDDINLQQIIAISNDLAHRESDKYCEDYLQVLSENTERMNWLRLGIFLPSNQLSEEILINGCIKTAIAVFPDMNSADIAFQNLYTENNNQEATIITYNDADSDTVVFETPYTFDYEIIPNGFVVKREGENLLLVTKRCNTVVTIFVFKKNEKADQSTTFGMVVENDEIVSYAKQIRNRIEKKICPIIGSHE